MIVYEKRKAMLGVEFDRYVRDHPGFAARKNGTGLHLGANYLNFWRGVSNSWRWLGLAREP